MSTVFADYFSSLANSYRRYRPSYPPAVFRFLADNAPSNEVALDIGAGNGQAAAGLAHWFERVIAFDPSEEQIAHALPTAGVEFHVGRAEDIPVRDECADVITVAQSLHWFDQAAFFQEAERVLKPGGLLAVLVYGRLQVDPDIDVVIEDYYLNVVGDHWPTERKLVESGYEAIQLPFEPLEAPPIEMRVKWTFDELLGYLETWSASKRWRDAQDADDVFATDSIRPLLEPLWGEETRRVISFPLEFSVRQKPR